MILFAVEDSPFSGEHNVALWQFLCGTRGVGEEAHLVSEQGCDKTGAQHTLQTDRDEGKRGGEVLRKMSGGNRGRPSFIRPCS